MVAQKVAGSVEWRAAQRAVCLAERMVVLWERRWAESWAAGLADCLELHLVDMMAVWKAASMVAQMEPLMAGLMVVDWAVHSGFLMVEQKVVWKAVRLVGEKADHLVVQKVAWKADWKVECWAACWVDSSVSHLVVLRVEQKVGSWAARWVETKVASMAGHLAACLAFLTADWTVVKLVGWKAVGLVALKVGQMAGKTVGATVGHSEQRWVAQMADKMVALMVDQWGLMMVAWKAVHWAGTMVDQKAERKAAELAVPTATR